MFVHLLCDTLFAFRPITTTTHRLANSPLQNSFELAASATSPPPQIDAILPKVNTNISSYIQMMCAIMRDDMKHFFAQSINFLGQ